MKKHITALGLALALGIGASVAAEPITLDSLINNLTPFQRNAPKISAIFLEASKNTDFYQVLKANNWTFEGVTLPERYQVNAAFRNKDYEAITPKSALTILNAAQYKPWVVAMIGKKGDTLESYDWLQAQRLAAVGSSGNQSGAKIEFLDTLAAQILAASKAKGQ